MLLGGRTGEQEEGENKKERVRKSGVERLDGSLLVAWIRTSLRGPRVTIAEISKILLARRLAVGARCEDRMRLLRETLRPVLAMANRIKAGFLANQSLLLRRRHSKIPFYVLSADMTELVQCIQPQPFLQGFFMWLVGDRYDKMKGIWLSATWVASALKCRKAT